MAKELPYFKFFPAEWMKGDITICSMAAQGLFLNICTYYWMKDCNMCLTHVQQRFSKHRTELEELFNRGVVKKDDHDNIIIDFLDEQMSEFTELSEKRSKAGRSSGQSRRQKPSNTCSTHVQHLPNYIEKDIEKDIDKDKEKIKYMSELKVSDPLNQYEEIALSFWELCKANMQEFGIKSTDLNKAQYKNWVTPIRLAAEKDERTAEEFDEVWEFLSTEIPRNGFSWRQNIRSGSSLREKFEQLLMAARNPKVNKSSTQIAHENLKRIFEQQTAG